MIRKEYIPMKVTKLEVVESETPLSAVMQIVKGLNRNGFYRTHEDRVRAANILHDHGFLTSREDYRHMLGMGYTTKVFTLLWMSDRENDIRIGSRGSYPVPVSIGQSLLYSYSGSFVYTYVLELTTVGEKLQLSLFVACPCSLVEQNT